VKSLTQLRGRLAPPKAGDDSASARRDRSEGWRPRAALAAVVAVCVAVTGIAVAGAGNASPGVKFAAQGRWIYNSTLGTLFHVNGSTKNVEGQIPLPGAGPGTQVVETDRSGYALAAGRIYEFSKSDLQVLDPKPAPVNEHPVGLEAGSAAFAVYRQAGRVIRFSDNLTIDAPGVPLGQPVVTSTGTLWVHRPDNGQLCQLPLDADRLSCPARTTLGHTGALTVVGGNQVVFVDTTSRAMFAVDGGGLGRQVALPLPDLPAGAIVAPNDVAGRVAILDPQRNVLHLIDTAELTGGKPDAKPIRKQLRKGQYERIASSGNSVALIDDSTDTLVTLDRDGNEKAVRRIPPPSAKAKVGPGDRAGLFRGGDSRLYVASKAGEKVMVVDDGGDVTPVDTDSPKPDRPKTPKPSDQPTTTPSRPADPTTTRPPEPPKTTEHPNKPDPTRTTDPGGDKTNRPDRPGPPASSKPDPKPDPKPTVQASRPGAPRSVSGRAGTNSAFVSWEAAAPNGAPVTQYRVTWSGGSKVLGASERSTNVSGLTSGTGYTFTVRAVNRVGTGPGSSTTRLVPDGGAADAPPNFKVTAGNGKISLSWSRPNLHGGTFQGYQYTASSASSQKSSSSRQTSYTFTGLDNGTSYRVTVRAITSDAQGNLIQGKAASRTITPGGGGGSSGPTLTASRGADTTHGGGDQACNPPGCAFIRVVGKGLKPNTQYFFQPFTTQWRPSNPGATLTTGSDGSILIDDRFATDAPGQQVWVVASAPGEQTVTSNKFTWRS
jgi:hypothetical protein